MLLFLYSSLSILSTLALMLTIWQSRQQPWVFPETPATSAPQLEQSAQPTARSVLSNSAANPPALVSEPSVSLPDFPRNPFFGRRPPLFLERVALSFDQFFNGANRNWSWSKIVGIHIVRTRGGNRKFRAIRLEAGNFSWGSEGISKKTRVIAVAFHPSNNELVRTNTLTKSAIVQIDAAPFRQW